MKIRMTDSRVFDVDEDLVVLCLGNGDLLDYHGTIVLLVDEGALSRREIGRHSDEKTDGEGEESSLLIRWAVID